MLLVLLVAVFLLATDGKVELVVTKAVSPASLKYLLSGLFKNKDADLCSCSFYYLVVCILFF